MVLTQVQLEKITSLLRTMEWTHIQQAIALLDSFELDEETFRTLLEAIFGYPLPPDISFDAFKDCFTAHSKTIKASQTQPHKVYGTITYLALWAWTTLLSLNPLHPSHPESLSHVSNTLDLSKQQLRDLPDSIRVLSHVTTLNLQHNRFTTVPTVLATFSNLKSLNLRYNKLSTVSLPTLGPLERLNLSANGLESLDVQSLPSTLQELYIQDNPLTELPNLLAICPNLTHLNLREHELTRLPEWLMDSTGLRTILSTENFDEDWMEQLNESAQKRLVSTVLHKHIDEIDNLDIIDLSYQPGKPTFNGFTQAWFLGHLVKWNPSLSLQVSTLSIETHRVPSCIEYLTHLTRLNLSSSGLQELPSTLLSLTNLVELHLGQNDLTELPENIDQFTQLEKLDITANCLSELPQSLTHLTQLRDLSLTGNSLEKLPHLEHLRTLETLSLAGNCFSELPPHLFEMTSLTSLYLNGNDLSFIPKEIGNLTNLNELWLAYNQLTVLPDTIGSLSRLESLGLDLNSLRVLPDSFYKLTNLKWLYIESNPLTDDTRTALEAHLTECDIMQ